MRDLEASNFLPEEVKEVAITIEHAVERYLKDAKARNVAPVTLQKLRYTLEVQLVEYAKKKGMVYLEEFTVDGVRDFRATWENNAPITAVKRLERVRSFFKFCQASGWITTNPAASVKPPKVTSPPTLPFTNEEMEKILWAYDLFSVHGRYKEQNRTGVKALVLLMRHTGLRISDAVLLKRERIADGKLFIRTMKTGTAVSLPLPPIVLSALKELPTIHPEYFFWGGAGIPKSCLSIWDRTLRRLFEIAGIEGGHSHRFRNSMAVDLLQRGTPVDAVAAILGNTPAIVQKHCAPWVAARQTALEGWVKKTWN